jgi:hypothetical protein
VAAPLDRIRRAEGFGSLVIITGSPQAHIFVNGHFRGRGRRLNIPRLATGLYRVHLVIRGKKTPHRDVEVAAGRSRRVTF